MKTFKRFVKEDRAYDATRELKTHDDWMQHMVNSDDKLYHAIAAEHGPSTVLPHLMNHSSWHIRTIVASRSKKVPELLDHMIHDPHEYVRYQVALHGKQRHLDQLVNDSNHSVRYQVAQRTNKQEHLDKLASDPVRTVRHEVAKRTTNPSHLLTFVTSDEDSHVKWAANNRLHELGLDK